jgi:hypothetical protein
MIRNITRSEGLLRAWLGLLASGSLVVGVSVALNLYPVSVLVERLRGPWQIYDVAPPASSFAGSFGVALIAWAVLALWSVATDRRRWLLAAAAAAGVGAWWLVRAADPFWTELTTVVSALGFLAVALPALLLATSKGRPNEA